MSKKDKDTDKQAEEKAAQASVPQAQTPANHDQRVSELEEQLLRVRADFENYKRRAEEERFRIASVAQAEVLLQLLPVIDNFDRAFKDVPKEVTDSPWYEGVEAIRKQFEQLLSSLGVERIESVGRPFDPNLHEAITHEASKEYDEGIISEEFEAGYKAGDTIIRHSKVKVSSGKQ